MTIGTVNIGNIAIGSDNPVIVQSMTNTDTSDTNATVKQIIKLVNSGCQMVRVSTRNIREAENLKNIQSQLSSEGITIPLIADIHFNPKVGEIAAQYCEKVRINPGNYISEKWNNELPRDKVITHICEKLTPLVNICKQNNTAIRIGVNHGSLSNRILQKYGNTVTGMVESLLEFIEAFRKLDFHNLVVALKASDVKIMIEANLLLKKALDNNGYNYPFHLGVTEAGNGIEGRIKSAAGIGYLLSHGIGDTIRVSLTENPFNEIPVALKIVNLYGSRNLQAVQSPEKISINADAIKNINIPVITETKSKYTDFDINNISSHKGETDISVFNYRGVRDDDLPIRMAVDIISYYYSHTIRGLYIKSEESEKASLCALIILQITRLRTSFTEFVACPTCARTTINVENIHNKLKEKAGRMKNLKIGVMGCIVNGPGEMHDADYGIVGKSLGKADLYRKGKVIQKNVNEEDAVETLLRYIRTK